MSPLQSFLRRSVFVLGTTLALAAFAERDAQACGGCFAPPGPGTQVTAHRMAFAVSPRRTILWDQFQYTGSPKEFGWVLPIRGKVDVGVSSDQLFQRLENGTAVQIVGPPTPICPSNNRGVFASASDESATPGASYDAGVNVWDQKTVGPYEATQLSATDGNALRTWLRDHDYVLPAAVEPVIDEYIKEGFGFIVIKLVPDADVTRMVPIRIAFDGANPSLPLRMIAAGTGAKVGLKLFVLGEGRWETKNFPTLEIKTDDLVWDYAAMGSNYNQLFVETLAKNEGRTWVAESSDDLPRDSIFAGLPGGTTVDDAGSTVFAKDTDTTDIDRAFPGRTTLTVTRLFAELPQSALAQDLDLQASTAGKLPRIRNVTNTKNHPCPGSDSSSVFGCAANNGTSTFTWLGLGFAGVVALSVARRRRAPLS